MYFWQFEFSSDLLKLHQKVGRQQRLSTDTFRNAWEGVCQHLKHYESLAFMCIVTFSVVLSLNTGFLIFSPLNEYSLEVKQKLSLFN